MEPKKPHIEQTIVTEFFSPEIVKQRSSGEASLPLDDMGVSARVAIRPEASEATPNTPFFKSNASMSIDFPVEPNVPDEDLFKLSPVKQFGQGPDANAGY